MEINICDDYPLLSKNKSLDLIHDIKKLAISEKYKNFIEVYGRDKTPIKKNLNLRLNSKCRNINISNEFSKSDLYSFKLPTIKESTLDIQKLVFFEYLKVPVNMIDYNVEYLKNDILKLNFLKIYNLNQYSPCFLKKKFNKKKDKKTILKLNSFSITLSNCGSVGYIHELHLPFEFLTIFSLCSHEEVIQTLSKCIILDDNCLRLDPDIRHLIKKLENKLIINTLDKIDFKTNISFYWFTDNEVYNVTLHCPYISFELKNENVILKKLFDSDLLLYLYSVDFKDWDYYILNDLISNKQFRNNFTTFLSKKTINKFYLNNNIKPYCLYNKLEDISIFSIYTNNHNVNYYLRCYGYSFDTKKNFINFSKNNDWRTTFEMLRIRKNKDIELCINNRTKFNHLTGIFKLDDKWLYYLYNEIEFNYNFTNFKESKKYIRLINPRIEWESYEEENMISGKITLKEENFSKLDSIYTLDEFYIFLSANLGDILDNREEHKIESPLTRTNTMINRLKISSKKNFFKMNTNISLKSLK